MRTFSFSTAYNALKDGRKVSRYGWDESEFIFLVPGSTFKVNRAPLLGIYEEGTEVTYRSHIDIRIEDGSISVWTPSQTDILSEDWYLVD